MFLLERFENIPIGEVGQFVQRMLAEGATVVVVHRGADGSSCSVSVQRE